MKIVFICGCLEPGKDGVGDYTRRLSAELIDHGVEVSILAYNDKFVDSKTDELQKFQAINISCLRLPKILDIKVKTNIAKKWIDSINPDFISLQFVLYAFNNKGLPISLGNQFKKIGGDRKWHIMFHELWLGLGADETLKDNVIGFLQKYLVKALVKKLNVKVVNTHTQLYMQELKTIKVYSVFLPIFSNIPFVSQIETKRDKEYNNIKLVMFGSVRPGAPKTDLAKELKQFSINNLKRKISLTLVGKSGEEQLNWADEFKKQGINVKLLGELKGREVSLVLQNSSFGITTVPSFLLEKSGTVAAMLEHKLPVLIVAKKWKPKNNFDLKLQDGLMEYEIGNVNNFIKLKVDNKNIKGAKSVAEKFLSYLK